MTGRSLLMFGTGLIYFLLGYLSDPLLCSSLHDVFFLPSLKFIHVNWLYLLYYDASLNMSFLYYLCLDSIPSTLSCDALLSRCYCKFEPLHPDLVTLHLLELAPDAGWNHLHARWNKGLWRTKKSFSEADQGFFPSLKRMRKATHMSKHLWVQFLSQVSSGCWVHSVVKLVIFLF